LAASGGSLGGSSSSSTGGGTSTSTGTGGCTATWNDSASNSPSSSTPAKQDFSFREWTALSKTISENGDSFAIRNGSNGDNAVAKIIDTLYK
jgi:hypothetical protein